MSDDTQQPRPYRVTFVCTGNICRSPMAEVVLRAHLEVAGLGKQVLVDSAGTGGWHEGERADVRALRALSLAAYDGSGHRATQFQPHWFAERDLIIGLDSGHVRALRAMAPAPEDRARVRLLREFDPAADSDLDVADPYYDEDEAFTTVLEQVEAACPGLLSYLTEQVG